MSTGRAAMILARRFAVMIRRLALVVYSVEGEYEGHPLRLLIADDNDTLHYIKHLVFPDGANVSRKGCISALSAPRLLNSDADMVVVGANQLLTSLYSAKGFYVVPKFVRQILPVEDHPDNLVSRLGKKTRATVRQALERWPDCEITTGLDLLDEFYYKMYKPYATKRFGADEGVCSYDRVRNDLRRGMFALLRTDGQPVFGAIMFQQGQTMRLAYSGVMDGYEGLARQGGMTAIFYHTIMKAYSSGCSEINLGHSRPFLSDGVLRFKMKWGAEILDDDDGVASFALAAPGNTDQAMRFLAANPFFYIHGGQLRTYQGRVEHEG